MPEPPHGRDQTQRHRSLVDVEGPGERGADVVVIDLDGGQGTREVRGAETRAPPTRPGPGSTGRARVEGRPPQPPPTAVRLRTPAPSAAGRIVARRRRSTADVPTRCPRASPCR